MSQETHRPRRGSAKLPAWLRRGWREVYRGKATIVAVLLLAAGILFIIGAATLLSKGIGHDIVRDFGIAALISGLLGSAYEYVLRQDLEESVQDKLKDALDEDTNLRDAGVVKIHPEIDTGLLREKFGEAIRAKAEVRILQTRTALEDYGLLDRIHEAVVAGCEVKILLLNPESIQVRYRAHAMERDAERFKRQITDEIRELAKRYREPGRIHAYTNIVVKVYDCAPAFHIFNFGSTKLLGPYWRGRPSTRGPQFEIREKTPQQEQTPLANLANKHFADLWEDKRPFNSKSVTEDAWVVLDRLDKKAPPGPGLRF